MKILREERTYHVAVDPQVARTSEEAKQAALDGLKLSDRARCVGSVLAAPASDPTGPAQHIVEVCETTYHALPAAADEATKRLATADAIAGKATTSRDPR